MITYIFIYSAMLINSGIAFSVGFENIQTCKAYAQAYILAHNSAKIRTAECVSLYSNNIETFKSK